MIVVAVASARPPARPHQPGAQRDHQQPRAHLQRRYQDVRQDVLAGQERQQADGDDRSGVGEGDDPSQGGGVPDGAAAADEVGGDQGLAVTGGEGVQPAEQRRQAPFRSSGLGGALPSSSRIRSSSSTLPLPGATSVLPPERRRAPPAFTSGGAPGMPLSPFRAPATTRALVVFLRAGPDAGHPGRGTRLWPLFGGLAQVRGS